MKKYTKAQKKHDMKVALCGAVGAVGLFVFSILLASLGPIIEQSAQNFNNSNEEDSSMYIEESSLDDIRDKMEEVSVEINGKQYILVDTAVDILQEYLEEED